jgi:hypothetical protein
MHTRRTSQTFHQSGLPTQRRISDFHVRGAYRSKSNGGRSVHIPTPASRFICDEASVSSPASPSWNEAMDLWYLVSGRKKKARTSWAPARAAPRPYHHCGVMESAIGPAKRTQTAVRLTWIACWPIRPLLRSWRKKISYRILLAPLLVRQAG